MWLSHGLLLQIRRVCLSNCQGQNNNVLYFILYFVFERPFPAYIFAYWSNITCLPAVRMNIHRDTLWKLKCCLKLCEVIQTLKLLQIESDSWITNFNIWIISESVDGSIEKSVGITSITTKKRGRENKFISVLKPPAYKLF